MLKLDFWTCGDLSSLFHFGNILCAYRTVWYSENPFLLPPYPGGVKSNAFPGSLYSHARGNVRFCTVETGLFLHPLINALSLRLIKSVKIPHNIIKTAQLRGNDTDIAALADFVIPCASCRTRQILQRTVFFYRHCFSPFVITTRQVFPG